MGIQLGKRHASKTAPFARLDSSRLMMINERFRKFLLVQKARALRPITIKGYFKCVELMLRRIGENHPTRPQVVDYIDWMHGKNYSFSYIHNSIRAAELWMGFIGRPLRLGRQKKPRPIVKNTLSESELVNMAHHCKNSRELAILATLAYSGIRPKEFCNLRAEDMDLGSNTVRILQGKGVKDRIVWISPQCSRAVIKYLTEYQRKGDSFLFTTLVRGNQYKTGDLRKFIKTIAKRAGIEKRVYPYLLRHSLATNLLNRGANIFTVRDQLGHAFLETTLIYIHSLPFGVKNDYQKAAPCYL